MVVLLLVVVLLVLVALLLAAVQTLLAAIAEPPDLRHLSWQAEKRAMSRLEAEAKRWRLERRRMR